EACLVAIAENIGCNHRECIYSIRKRNIHIEVATVYFGYNIIDGYLRYALILDSSFYYDFSIVYYRSLGRLCDSYHGRSRVISQTFKQGVAADLKSITVDHSTDLTVSIYA